MFYGQCWKCGERWELGTAPTCKCNSDDDDTQVYRSELEAAVKAEREACARVCDELAARDKLSNYFAVAARAIRARGNT